MTEHDQINRRPPEVNSISSDPAVQAMRDEQMLRSTSRTSNPIQRAWATMIRRIERRNQDALDKKPNK